MFLPFLPKSLPQLRQLKQVFTLFIEKLTSVGSTEAGFYPFIEKLTSVGSTEAGFYPFHRKTYLSWVN
jgi:hypothetical protein